jgi:hypothetical protein
MTEFEIEKFRAMVIEEVEKELLTGPPMPTAAYSIVRLGCERLQRLSLPEQYGIFLNK